MHYIICIYSSSSQHMSASCNVVALTHAVVCNPPCANGTGVCVANNTCSCAPGYFGDTCSEQGKLHSTLLISATINITIHSGGVMYICTSICGYVYYMHAH